MLLSSKIIFITVKECTKMDSVLVGEVLRPQSLWFSVIISRFNTTNSKIVYFKKDNSVSFDKKSRYMSKIHVILVVLNMYIF